MLCSGLQTIDDPQKLAGENDYLGGILRVRRDVPVTLRIFIKTDCAGEQVGHRFLFGGW